MLSAIFDPNLDVFEYLVVAATALFLFAAVLVRPRDPNPPLLSWSTTIAYVAAAVFAFGFLFLN